MCAQILIHENTKTSSGHHQPDIMLIELVSQVSETRQLLYNHSVFYLFIVKIVHEVQTDRKGRRKQKHQNVAD